MNTMTKGERADLCTLVRKRERLAKTAAAQRAAEVRADFEAQLAAIYSYDQDQVWKQAYAAADEAVRQAKAVVAARCAELGIPEEFSPGLNIHWHRRGENAINERRVELRRVAETRIAAMLKAANTQIELTSVKLQTEVISGGLCSLESQAFLERLPAPETLMPVLDAKTLLTEPCR